MIDVSISDAFLKSNSMLVNASSEVNVSNNEVFSFSINLISNC